MKGALGDFARSTVHPTSILKWGSRIGSAWKAMFEHIEDMERADATRDQLAAKILGSYQLVEIAPETYALKRGKWGLDALRGAYHTSYNEVMMDTGVAENFDFARLKRSIDTSKSV